MEKKNEILGKRLKLLRNKKGGNNNQEDIARDLGISRARYSHYENNHVEPDIDMIKKLAKYYNVTTDYLLGYSDQPDSEEDALDSIKRKIATEFPEADLMFEDLANMTAEELEEVYEFRSEEHTSELQSRGHLV